MIDICVFLALLMKYDILVSGDFTNIKGLQMEQKFCFVPKCTACNYTRRKVDMSEDDDYIDDFDDNSIYDPQNLTNCDISHCLSCDNKISVDVQGPEGTVKHTVIDECGDEIVIKYCPVKAEGCLVSRIESKGAVIVEVSPISFNVVTEDDRLIYCCRLDDKKCLAGRYGQNKIYSIVQCECKIREVK